MRLIDTDKPCYLSISHFWVFLACIDQAHVHVDSLPTSSNENEEVDSDSESIPDEDHDDELWRAEWMEEAGRQPNQPVELDFKILGG